uniref:Uncharacterized protein n=1 Tax=Glossina austeni TaxID=7395 RepID=A0A1A9VDD7_GLOAU
MILLLAVFPLLTSSVVKCKLTLADKLAAGIALLNAIFCVHNQVNNQKLPDTRFVVRRRDLRLFARNVPLELSCLQRTGADVARSKGGRMVNKEPAFKIFEAPTVEEACHIEGNNSSEERLTFLSMWINTTHICYKRYLISPKRGPDVRQGSKSATNTIADNISIM